MYGVIGGVERGPESQFVYRINRFRERFRMKRKGGRSSDLYA